MESTPESIDEAVLHHLSRGEVTQAMEVLAQHYEKHIIRFCAKALANRDNAEDAAQEVFLAVYKALPKFRGESSLKTWLYAIAYNTCKKILRQQQRRQSLFQQWIMDIAKFFHPEPSGEPEDCLACVRRKQCTQLALSKLRVWERQVLQLRLVEQMTLEETAKILGASSKSISRWMEDVRPRFKKFYEGCIQRGA